MFRDELPWTICENGGPHLKVIKEWVSMNTVTISAKYQVVIVPPIDEAMGLFAGIDSDPLREKEDRQV